MAGFAVLSCDGVVSGWLGSNASDQNPLLGAKPDQV